jgi:hypothetical protein
MRRAAMLFALVLTATNPVAGYADVASQSSSTRIFRCELEGTVTFSDRPCVDQTSEIVLKPYNSFDADSRGSRFDAKVHQSNRRSANSAEKGDSQAANAPGDKGSIAAEQLKQKLQAQQRCVGMSKQLKSVEAKLRTGYTAKQHDVLQARRRNLEEQLRRARCR